MIVKQKKTKKMEVKSVYNFVPAPIEDDVFKPDWAEQVSHDIPFSDGESGEIELTITAKTPIFIRNGHTKRDKELFEKQRDNKLLNPTQEEKEAIERYLSFSHVVKNGQKQFFIPATSIKGMVRNVLEIMSLSRMTQVADDIFGFRNLNHKRFKTEVAQNSELKTGWLEKINGNWIIKECEFGRVKMHNFRGKTIQEKYSLKNAAQKTSFIKEIDLEHNRGILYKENSSGIFKGYYVFYGDIQNKKYEYIFTEPNSNSYNVDFDLIERFKKIDDKLDETQWQYLNSNKNPYPNNRIPVFFALDENENIKHFGFSRLYKMTNTNYLNELEPLNSYYNRNNPYEFDLAETIFGTVEDTDKNHGDNRNKTTLKGRVFFSHAFVNGDFEEMEEIPIILASPKASYFPFYLKDKKTYLDNDAELKGFKKYLVHETLKDSDFNAENEKIKTTIKPLNQGVKFKGKIRYHNLRKAELGALLSAITFHLQNDILDHNIGSAKPLGYGRLNIQINSNLNIKKYLSDFEQMMQQHSKNVLHKNWLELKALKELYAMAIDHVNKFILEYPKIETNEFANYVKNNIYLKYYSEYFKGKSLGFISIKDIYNKEKREKEEKELLRKNLENKYFGNIEEADKYFNNKNYKKALVQYEKANEVKINIDKSNVNNKISKCKEEIVKINNKYKILIEKADVFFNSKEWEEAKNIYLQAIELNEEDNYPKQQKNKCLKEIEKSNLSLDKFSDISNFNEGRKIIQIYFENKKEYTDDEKQIIKEFIFKCYGKLISKKSKDRFMKFNKDPWKLLVKIFGKETVQQWYDELNK